ncbi:Platinum sensitivity protein [Phlyctochytrium planicorne]|nr:Platinum sensitivity protein [Phlyctochytrium planicorne]
METGNKRRVKVYELSNEGQWIDKGTGQVSHQYVEIKDAVCIVVRSEDDGAVLLNSKIRKEDIYHRQQSTLIVWTEQNGLDLALSFQEAEGCNELWNIIADVQKKLVAVNGVADVDQIPIAAEEDPAMVSDDFRQIGSFTLPAPTIKNLAEIEQSLMVSSRSLYVKEQFAQLIVQENFIEKLIPLLSDLEDLESTEDLYCLSNIMKMIIFLTDSTIYEIILQDSFFLPVVGILEYDRDFPNIKANHRQYLTESVRFKEVIPIKNPEIVQKIKQTYRLQFLKDVVLARLLDDNTFSALNSLVFFNHMEIVGHFQQDNEYLEGLFRILTLEDYSEEKKKEVVLFLHEICSIAKNLQVATRAAFYRALGQHGLFAIFEYTLADDDIAIRLAATAILWSILEHDPILLRSFCVAQIKQKSTPLIDFIIQRFLNETDAGIRSQLVDIIRVLLDTSGADSTDVTVSHASQDSDSDEFLNVFYESYMAKLATPVLNLNPVEVQGTKDGEILQISSDLASTCSHICELLCFVVKQHSYRSKYYILGSNIIQKTLLLLRAKESYVRLAALRVFRVCIGMKDEFYNRHLLKNDVFGPILEAFRLTNGRYNLLNSACLDLFEFIRKENIKGIISNIVQSHRKLFDDITYVDTFKSLVLRYEQNSESISSTDANGATEASAAGAERKTQDGWGRVDHDEEAYFESNDEDDTPLEESSKSAKARALQRSAQALSLSPVSPSTPTSAIARSSPKQAVAPSIPRLVDYPDDDEQEKAPASIAEDPPKDNAAPSGGSEMVAAGVKRIRSDDNDDNSDDGNAANNEGANNGNKASQPSSSTNHDNDNAERAMGGSRVEGGESAGEKENGHLIQKRPKLE